jgi:hypothetical protein
MPKPISSNSNLAEAYRRLTGDWLTERSGGVLKPLTPAGAAGLLGGNQVETGSYDLTDMDVVEQGNGQKGRGLSQFTGVRRSAYDRAREKAIQAGHDPNSLDFQMGYMVDEYLGKHDTNGKSLSGWTKAFQQCGQMTDPQKSALCWSETYFRPSDPHNDRRMAGAKDILRIGKSGGFTKTRSSATDNPYVKREGDLHRQF